MDIVAYIICFGSTGLIAATEQGKLLGKVVKKSAEVIKVCVWNNNAQEVSADIDKYVPDLAVIALFPDDSASLPIANISKTIQHIRRISAHTCILVTCSQPLPHVVLDCLHAGAHGYCYVDSIPNPRQLEAAVQATLEGYATIDRDVAMTLLDVINRSMDDLSFYTPPEREILGLRAKGLSVRDISTRSDVPDYIINNHMGNILLKVSSLPETISFNSAEMASPYGDQPQLEFSMGGSHQPVAHEQRRKRARKRSASRTVRHSGSNNTMWKRLFNLIMLRHH